MCLLEEAGIKDTSGNRKELDRAIKSILGTGDCSQTWQEIKNVILVDDKKRQDFINKLSAAIK
jgi:hypothetical protein